MVVIEDGSCPEVNAHGVSIVHKENTETQAVEIVNSFNRRITASTVMDFSGAGDNSLVRTAFSYRSSDSWYTIITVVTVIRLGALI